MALGFCFLIRVLHVQPEELFEVNHCVKLPQVQVLQDLIAGFLCHRNDCVIPFLLRSSRDCCDHVTDSEMIKDHPSDSLS